MPRCEFLLSRTAWIIYVNRTSASLAPANSEVTIYVNEQFIKCHRKWSLCFVPSKKAFKFSQILAAWHEEVLRNDISLSFCQGRLRLCDTFIVGNSPELPTPGLRLQLKCKESFGQSPSALKLFLLSAFVFPSYSFALFFCLWVRE